MLNNKETKELFFNSLANRISWDTGAKALLKRSVGKSMNEAPVDAIIVYASIVPKDVPKDIEFLWFSVACMFAACEGISVKERTFAQALGVLNERISTNGVDAKMLQILKTSVNEDSLLIMQISQLVLRLATKGIYFNIVKLLDDLISFYYGNTDIKLEWVKQYKCVD